MKNKTFNFEHRNLGNLTAIICSGDDIAYNKNIIPATFLVEYKDLDTMQFIYQIYMVYAKENDIFANIIGQYFDMETIPYNHEQIVANINNEYARLTQKKSSKNSQPLANNDGISAIIVKSNNLNNPIYEAKIIVRERDGNLQAHIEEQKTNPTYQKQGLMTQMLTKILPTYCALNNLSAISLEAGAIGGVDKPTLERIYTQLGFEQEGELFIRPVDFEQVFSIE